jgi:hypothetical protein
MSIYITAQDLLPLLKTNKSNYEGDNQICQANDDAMYFANNYYLTL